jgi:hypothetical protein
MRVLGLQTSHLLLKCTNLGYGTVLTATCARQGCSAGGLGLVFLINNSPQINFCLAFSAPLFGLQSRSITLPSFARQTPLCSVCAVLFFMTGQNEFFYRVYFKTVLYNSWNFKLGIKLLL